MTDVCKFYKDVIEDVINQVKEDLGDDGVDSSVLEELKKLWTNKLEETHVFEPEPVASRAVNYLNWIQRSQVQLRPSGNILQQNAVGSSSVVPIRPLNPSVMLQSSITNATIGNSNLTGARVPMTSANVRHLVATNAAAVNNTTATGSVVMSAAVLPTVTGQNRIQLHAPGINVGTVNGQPQAPLSSLSNVDAASVATSAGLQLRAVAPQLTALPSGLTGHLVQIGQQTYLVPQSVVNVRQPGAPFSVSQFLSAPNAPAATTTTTFTNPSTTMIDPNTFQRTQVDGIHDSDDDRFIDTPSSSQQQRTPGVSINFCSPASRLGADQSINVSDDDDDDDDDLVPATPGCTPSSNTRIRLEQMQGHRSVLTPAGTHYIGRVSSENNSLLSAPATPMSPPSVSSQLLPMDLRQHPCATRTSNASYLQQQKQQRTIAAAGGKRRRCRRFGAADTDTELDDDDDDEYDDDEVDAEDDIGDDVEIMTNATMTPAAHGGDLADEEDEDTDHRRSVTNAASSGSHRRVLKARRLQPKSRSVLNAASNRARTNRNRTSVLDQSLLSPNSELDPHSVGQQARNADDSVLDEDDEHDAEGEEEEEEEPLNSGDDVSDEEPEVLFESDNVIVCQYDKIHRSRNKWRFHLKDGIMAINGRDHVFQKAIGEAEW